MRSRKTTNLALGLLLAVGGLVASFAVVATAPAQSAATTSSSSTDTTTTPTTTAPLDIANDVTVGGVPVGGMGVGMARATIESAFAKSLVLRIGSKRVALAPSEIAARASVESALNAAQSAAPGTAVTLRVAVNNYKLHKYVLKLGKRFNRAPLDAGIYLRNLRPRISDGHVGWTIKVSAAQRAIRSALAANRRIALTLPLNKVSRKLTKSNFGPVIVIRRGSNRLYLYKGEKFVKRFPVATGQSAYPTPLGHYEIVVKWANPWWYPPDSAWAKGEKPVPPGPGNPLGTRWMGLSASGVGIHGTPQSGSIGYSLSHGCIRMYIPDAEWLFNHVVVGTQVFIVVQ
ncbi:MAG: L,D-transpeptidase family protein [Gaiellaceae bacterium]